MIGLVKTGAPLVLAVVASAGATAAAVPTRPAIRTAVRGRAMRGMRILRGREYLRPDQRPTLPKGDVPTVECGQSDVVRRLALRYLSAASSSTLRSRTVAGVTSTHSSSR